MWTWQMKVGNYQPKTGQKAKLRTPHELIEGADPGSPAAKGRTATAFASKLAPTELRGVKS